MEQPILFKPKLFLIEEIKNLFIHNIISLTLEDLNRELGGLYGNLLGLFFGVEMIEINNLQAYLKPLRLDYKNLNGKYYGGYSKYFGKFKKILPNAKLCTCQIIIKDSGTDPESYKTRYFFLEGFKIHHQCICGRKIDHYHCNICGGRENSKNRMIKLEHIKTFDDSAKNNFLNHLNNTYLAIHVSIHIPVKTTMKSLLMLINLF